MNYESDYGNFLGIYLPYFCWEIASSFISTEPSLLSRPETFIDGCVRYTSLLMKAINLLPQMGSH